jgi:CBS domain-containing protein
MTTSRLAHAVETAMTRAVVQVADDAPMAEVWALVASYDYNAFPVVAGDGRLVGMITKGDVLRTARAALADRAVWREPVARRMAHGVLALRPAESLETAVGLMAESGHRSLPVIDAAGRVVGIVSRNDLMAAVAPEVGPPGAPAPERAAHA